MDDLNAAQRQAVLETSGPVLVLAGPGTGKTKMLVAKYRHLVIDQKLHPDRILITTFTTKATEELEDRISAALTDAHYYSKVDVQNFHSFCLRLLQEFGSEIGLARDPPVLDTIALTRFLYENRDALEWKFVPFIRWVQGPLEKLVLFAGRCLSEGLSPQDARARATQVMERADEQGKQRALEYLDYAHNYGVVMGLLEKKGVLTYDLMLYHAVALLESRGDILQAVQKRYDYLLVDEVQDNNGLQARLIVLIAGKRPIVTVVGDEDQGIYKFRGAQRGILTRFRDAFNPKLVYLWENYRSSANIVEASKALIAKNPDRFEGKKLEARGGNQGLTQKVDVLAYPNETQEAIHIARLVQEELDRGRQPRDIAILYRSLNQKDRLLEELEARRIRYEITNTGELLRLREVRDLWAWLAALNDPFSDNPAFERVLSGREVGIPLLDLGRIQHRFHRMQEEKAKAEGKEIREARLNLVDVLRDLEGAHIDDESRHRLRWARRSLEVLSSKVRGLTALETAYEVLGWLKPQRRFPLGDTRSQQVWLNLGHFLQVIKDYEESYPDAKGLPGFLSHLDYLDRQGAEFQEGEVDKGEDSVKILTAHRAKGLQFPVVIVASCCKQRFPGNFRGDWMHPILDPEGMTDPGLLHIEEERRVFYVAMTRAEQRLVITHPLTVGGKERARSQFIDEILDGAAPHVDQQTVTEELPPAETLADVAEQELHADLHGALAVNDGMDSDELRDRMRRIVEATLATWQDQVPVSVLEEVAKPLAGLGVKLPMARPVPEKPPEHLRLSASALNTYRDCPRKFQFQNVLRVPRKASAGAAVAGSNVHRALEVFHREHKDDWRTCTTEQLLAIYEKESAESRFSSPKEAAQYRERDRRILGQYLETEKKNPGEPTHFEVPFRYEMPELNVSFMGYIDRVDEHKDGSVEIIDYKTGSRDTPNKIVAEDFQIPLYVLALEDGKGRKVKAGTLYWMRDAGDATGPIVRDRIPRVKAGKAKGEFTDEAVRAFKEKLTRTVQDIRAGRFPEHVDDFGCRFCDYRLICPAWGG